jgi:ketosteroid isomerase-like protein
MLLLSCDKKNSNSSLQKNSIDYEMMLRTIDEFHISYELAIKENRLDDLDNLYATDSKVIPPGGDEWNDLLKLAEERDIIVAYDSMLINIEETKILNDSTAYDWGTSLIYFTDREGKPQKIDDSFFVILKKRKGQWKIFRELSSAFVE